MSRILENSKVYYNDALSYMHENQISKAQEKLLKSISLYSRDKESLNLLGLTYYLLCDFNKAKYYWNISKSIDDENNKALEYLKTLESDSFRSIIDDYNQSLDLIEQSNYKEAVNKLSSVINAEENLIEPYAITGLCYLALEQDEPAKANIEKALAMDKDNVRYLQYLVDINERIITAKPKSGLNNKILIAAMALLIIIFAALYFNEQNKYSQAFSEYEDYDQKIKDLNIALNNKETELRNKEKELNNKNSDLLNKEAEIKALEDKLKTEQNVPVTENQDKYISENEGELFKKAYDNLLSANHKEAIDQFSFIAERGTEENLSAESLYFLSLSYERNEDYSNANKYYEEYINRYPDRNYYDDSLYNYGLLLYKQGHVNESKEILNKLKTQAPNSIFNNSKTDYILNN